MGLFSAVFSFGQVMTASSLSLTSSSGEVSTSPSLGGSVDNLLGVDLLRFIDA